ncbi:MAG: methyltransferase domain-containing protein [Candidatus Binatales bacterium]
MIAAQAAPAKGTPKKARPIREPRGESPPDLSGEAFADVDAGPDPKHWIAYLDLATAQLRELKSFSYGLLGLKPGAAVLDLGCGTGDDARELAALVGADGLVIGVDLSRALIAEARKRSAESGLEVEFIVGNAERLDLARNSFDACRADRLLQHVSDPGRAVREMIRVASPGAVVQAIDRDYGMVALDSADRAATRAILDRICDGIRNGWIGRRLPALMRECGLKDVRTEARVGTTADFKIANQMLDLEAVARHARDEGLVSAPASAAWLKDLRQRHKQGQFFACWTIFVATGRKAK